MTKEYTLSRDPIFFATVAFFALLTAGMSSVLGQLRFLPIVQAVALTALLWIPLRRRDLRSALITVFLWLALAMVTVFLVTWWAPVEMERTFEDGFLHRAAYAEWYYANSPLPASFVTQPLASVVEVLGIVLGSLLTGGLVGAWFLMRVANLAAFSAASLLLTLPNGLWIVVALPVWSILQVIGGGGLLALLAEPLASGGLGAGLAALGQGRRRLLLIFGGLYALGLLLEPALAPFWHFTPVP
jgi:hypothetical protein